MKGKTIAITGIAALLVGCSANMVSEPGATSGSEYAPSNEEQMNKLGHVYYLNEGVSSIREARKEDAYRKMYNSCDGDYEITHSGTASSLPVALTQESGNTSTTFMASSSYVHFYYRCID